MTDEQRQAANRRCAEALGWTDIQWADDDADDFGVRVVNNWHGIPPGGGKRRWLPKPYDSLDTVADALPAGYALYVYPLPDGGYEAIIEDTTVLAVEWFGRGDTRQAAAGSALTSWLTARKEAT